MELLGRTHLLSSVHLVEQHFGRWHEHRAHLGEVVVILTEIVKVRLGVIREIEPGARHGVLRAGVPAMQLMHVLVETANEELRELLQVC